MSLLKIKLLETEVTSASLPLTWSVNKNWLKKNGADWDILFSTVSFDDDRKTEWRSKCKLTDLVHYVKFLRPGKNRIFAIIPCGYSESVSKYWDSRINGHFEWDIIGQKDGEPHIRDCYINEKSTHLDVDLPEEVFADEPPVWEKRWVNFFFSTKAVDQCDFRKRRLLAYTIQPILIVLMLIVRCIAFLVFLSVGASKLNARPLIHPNEHISDIWEESNEPWILKKTAHTNFAPMGLCIMFSPASVVLTFILCWLTMNIPTTICALIPLVGMFGLIVIAAIMGLIITIMDEKEHNEISTNDIDYLSAKKINTIQDLPKEKQTIQLKFTGIKSRICAPYRK